MMFIGIAGGIILLGGVVLALRRQKDIVIEDVPALKVTSSAFEDGGKIPVKYTGNGEDVSPELQLAELGKEAVSLVVIMDDRSIMLLFTITNLKDSLWQNVVGLIYFIVS